MRSWAKYERRLAAKLLLRSHRQRFIPLVGALSVAGVGLGVAALIVVIAVMTGFERDLQRKITAMSAHLWIQPRGDAAPDLAGLVAAGPAVVAAGRYATCQALLQSTYGATGAVLFGLDDDAATTVVRLKEHLLSGRLARFGETGHEVMLGRELARTLRVGPGDDLAILTAREGARRAPVVLKATVAGLFEVGMYDYDAHTAYLPLASVRALAGPATIPGVIARVKDVFEAHARGLELQVRLGSEYQVRDWLSMNHNLFYAIKVEKIVMFLILLTIVTVAAFNITSSLIMTVMEKTRAIGVLNTLGVPPRRMSQIFIWQGTAIGTAGVAAGVGLGCVICAAISVYPLRLPGGGSVYYLSTLPVEMNLWLDLVVIPAVALLLCVASAVYPARQAAKLDPVEAIRYE